MAEPKPKSSIQLHERDTRQIRTAGFICTHDNGTPTFSAEGKMVEILQCFSFAAFRLAEQLSGAFGRPISAYEAIDISLKATAEHFIGPEPENQLIS